METLTLTYRNLCTALEAGMITEEQYWRLRREATEAARARVAETIDQVQNEIRALRPSSS